jgi:hypothetical protein
MSPARSQSFCETKCATRLEDEAVILLKTHGKKYPEMHIFRRAAPVGRVSLRPQYPQRFKEGNRFDLLEGPVYNIVLSIMWPPGRTKSPERCFKRDSAPIELSPVEGIKLTELAEGLAGASVPKRLA